jgi:hypothetical protein
MVPYPDMPASADERLALVLDADLRLLAIRTACASTSPRLGAD